MKKKPTSKRLRKSVTLVNPVAYRAKHKRFPGPAGTHQFSPDTLPPAFTTIVDQTAHPLQPWRDLPPATGQPPYRLDLAQVLDSTAINRIVQSGSMILHAVGDTGGVNTVTFQENVATYMAYDFLPGKPEASPSFFYHLGDVVYYDGEGANYYSEFYEPYVNYHGPIFAIPGNHDGDVNPSTGETSLEAFVRNFCAQAAVLTKDNRDAPRTAMTQPNVYWTLITPLATIIGLYSNCPEGGKLGPDQIAWLSSELQAAPRSLKLILAVHHPVYSAYGAKPGSSHLADVITQASTNARRAPDLVLTGHVHNYQRFSASLLSNREIPIIVAGAGGYNKKMHTLSAAFQNAKLPISIPGSSGVLQNFNDRQHGYLKLTVTKSQIKGEYYAVPEPGAPRPTTLTPFDTFTA